MDEVKGQMPDFGFCLFFKTCNLIFCPPRVQFTPFFKDILHTLKTYARFLAHGCLFLAAMRKELKMTGKAGSVQIKTLKDLQKSWRTIA